MKIQIIKDDGTPRGAWVAVGITVTWLISGLVGLLVSLLTYHDMAGFVGVYTVFTGGCLSYVGIYFLKKYKELNNEIEGMADLIGMRNLRGRGNVGSNSDPKNCTAEIGE